MKDLTKTSKGSTVRIGRGLQATMPNRMRMLTLNVTMAGLALIITACGDDVQNRPPATTAATLTHKVDLDVEYFVDTLYGELISHNCVNCHATNKSKSDQPFADPNNANVAYNSAIKELVPNSQTIDPTQLDYLKDLDRDVSPATPATDFQTKVAAGHHCWTADCNNDANTLSAEIIKWAILVQDGGLIDDDPDDTGTNESKLVAPPDDSPRPTIVVNSDNRDVHKVAFEQYVYPVVRGSGPGSADPRCSQCHDRNAKIPETPYFADDDPDLAFDELVDNDKVNLNNPGSSRIYLRLFQDSHNCWSVCGPSVVGDDDTMLTAINAWINDPAIQALNQDFDSAAFNNSSALFLNNGQVTSGGARYDRWVIAKYEFTEGSGLVVNDSSGVAPLLPLTLSSANNCTWLSNYGVKFDNNCRARSQSVVQSLKLYDQIVPRGEYTIEVWIIPDNEAQEGPAVIASYSAGSIRRNFTMGQSTEYYDFANRNSGMSNNGASDQNAEPRLSTDDGDDDTHIDHVVKTNLQHLVMTYDTLTGRKIYVDGIPVLCETQSTSTPLCLQERVPDNINVVIGNILTWNPRYLFTLGSETNGANQWRGTMRMVAIHNRALTQAQIEMNFDAGVGQKFNLLFAIGDRTVIENGVSRDVPGLPGVPDNSYIWFQVSQYDYFSYLFLSPKFIVLDDAYDPTTIPSFSIQRMRIGLNGKEPAVSQAYSRMGPFNDKMPGLIDGSNYVQVTPIPPSTNDWTVPPTWSLSDIGTVIALENGVNNDQFFLTFELIATAPDKSRQLGDPATLSVTYSTGQAYVVGMRTFNEIDATMATLTQVNPSSLNQTTKDKISDLKAQLPSNEKMIGFIASQQMSIASLAGVYCKELINDTNLNAGVTRANYFGVADSVFTTGAPTPVSVLTPTVQGNIITALTEKIAGQVAGRELAIQPDPAVIAGQLNTLANGLKNACTTNLPSGITQDCTAPVRTKAIINAMCMAVLSSAAVTQQ